MKTLINLQVIVFFLLLSGCANIDVTHYRHEKPELDLPRFFSAPVQAWGMFQTRTGEVIKRFIVTIDGRMEGHQLVLDERFVYSDGTRQRRVWTLTPDGPGRWRGTADDVVGQAHGQIAGNTLRWRYTLNLEVEGTIYPCSSMTGCTW
ncbi:hypothetical protein ALQ33_00290 [Pseudomonas syringae pv. philadelphi]|uniref:Lipoprotein n=1 Tax=Pseudomonas syringae pv. philadelphi TaxID=251706 RepID=A0A3M3ZTI3_9PSED|nr:hypothetical protein ALQ33_00290 [Pseudomonas syringae pv. philadelphi]